MRYNLIRNLREPLELIKGVYVFDLFFVLGTLGISFMIAEYFVAEPLKYIYVGINTIFGIILSRKDAANPGKRFFQSIYTFYQKNSSVYFELENENKPKEIEDMINDLEKENHPDY